MSIVVWPVEVLPPASVQINSAPFSRSGGRSLGGLERVTRTDRGCWKIGLLDIPVHAATRRKTWNAIRTLLSGRAGLIAVPAVSRSTAPYASGEFEEAAVTTHDDDTTFDDGSGYSQGAIDVEMETEAAIGATSVTLNLIHGAEDLSGVRFSYNHALYETGRVWAQVGSLWTVEIFPSIRATIPAGASLEFDNPTCLARLQDDAGMDIQDGIDILTRASAVFVEAVDHWNDLAAA